LRRRENPFTMEKKVEQLVGLLASGFTLTSVCTTCSYSTPYPEATQHQQVLDKKT
jgi:hypothetical protein